MPAVEYTYYHYDELNRRVQTVHKSGGTNDTITPLDAVDHHKRTTPITIASLSPIPMILRLP